MRQIVNHFEKVLCIYTCINQHGVSFFEYAHFAKLRRTANTNVDTPKEEMLRDLNLIISKFFAVRYAVSHFCINLSHHIETNSHIDKVKSCKT